MSETDSTPPMHTNQNDAPPAIEEPKEILSQEILQGTQRVAIIHNGQRYFLSVTRNGKLILQK